MRIMVVGCGALGNEVLKNLVLLGVTRFVVVDFDVVEESNLTRSVLFRKSDVGRYKVDVVRQRMMELNPDIEVKTIVGDIAYDVGLGLLRQMDVIVGCVDSRWARYCIQRLCLRVGKSWVDGGIYELEGTARTFTPGCNCYACSLGIEGMQELRRRMPCSNIIRRREAEGHAPTTPIIASIIGAVQAQEAMRCSEMLDMPRVNPGRMFYYEGSSLTARILNYEAWDEDCPLHEEWSDQDSPRSPIKGEGLGIDDKCSTLFDSLKNNSTLPLEGGLRGVCTLILNTPFVDYIINRKTDERYEVMLPAHKVEEYVASHPQLRYEPLSAFYQHEYAEIDADFPYPQLTLRQLGIPEQDILRFRTPEGYLYIEL